MNDERKAGMKTLLYPFLNLFPFKRGSANSIKNKILKTIYMEAHFSVIVSLIAYT
jgi:hypothetical protein